MNEELNIRPIAQSHVDVDRKASREYIFGKKKKESPKARCCECGVDQLVKAIRKWQKQGKTPTLYVKDAI